MGFCPKKNISNSFAAQSQPNRSISEAVGYWLRKVGHLRQRQVVFESWGAGANGGQTRIDGQECYAIFGIGRDSYTMSCGSKTIALIRTCAVKYWTVWRKQSPRSGQLWPIGEELCSMRTTLNHTRREWLAKSLGSLIRRFSCDHSEPKKTKQLQKQLQFSTLKGYIQPLSYYLVN